MRYFCLKRRTKIRIWEAAKVIHRRRLQRSARGYDDRMRFEFEGEIFRWSARREDWYFAAVPEELSADIREIPRPPRGFGSVRVEVRIGGSRWRTSMFPDSDRGCYVLPLKKAVRAAENLPETGTVIVSVELLDV